jgi:hypothetical protein
MAPYLYKTVDFGQSWTPLVATGSPVRGFAHVVKEDTVSSNLLFLGTEFGLWISVDSGAHWAQYKGHDFPSVPVRDMAIHPRTSDLVLATHGRGIWIVDDISPLRQLTPEVLAKDAVFLESKPTQQRLMAQGGWAEGDGNFVGGNPPDGALITYYQKRRHVYGRLKLEVFDEKGQLVDTLPASSRRGITRVVWSMRLKPPKVPPAAVIAGEATVGPRIVPGTYTIKLTRGSEVYTTPIVATLDARAKFTVEDRKQEYAAAMRVFKLLGDLTFDVDRINGVRLELAQRGAALGKDPLSAQLLALSDRADTIRKKIVATKEGGAITGEERIREKTSQLYGALVFYEGKPADYYISRIDSLSHERQDVVDEFDAFIAKDLQSANKSLIAKKLMPVTPITREAWEKSSLEAEGGMPASGNLLGNHLLSWR